ncbi:MAG: toprim domain-containing protein, partial [Chromatiales bacterium]|nr:toprim domain-containing protein [Chromatiales bacterium]
PGWDNLLKAMSGHHAEEKLLTVGLLAKRDQGGCYDRFRDRIIFPIRDVRGRVIAFGGRMLGDDTPKYLNSPETPVFHKGRELYGLYEARKAKRELDRLLVVEGYMDVVMLAQHGVNYAVATLGTATTAQHLERLFRFVPELVFCFDGDRAGRQAAWRALEGALPALRDGRQARFMFLPDGEDPDSLVRKEGREGFEGRLVNAVTLSEFFYDCLTQRADTSTIDGRARLVELARPYLAKIESGVYRHMMTARLGELARVESGILAGILPATKTAQSQQALVRLPSRAVRRPATLQRKAVELLLRKPMLAQQVGDYKQLTDLEIPGVRLLVEMLDLLHENPHLNTASLLERWREHEYGRHLASLARAESLIPLDKLDDEFANAMRGLRRMHLDQRIERLRAKPTLSIEEKLALKQLLEERQGKAGPTPGR